MDCQWVQDRIGVLVDGELPPGEAAQVREHAEQCPGCGAELAEVAQLAAELKSADIFVSASTPAELWAAVEARLDAPAAKPRDHAVSPRRAKWMGRLIHRPLAMAASLALLVGAAVFVGVWLSPNGQVAEANVIDYAVLLDSLPHGVDTAVDRFLAHYNGHRVEASAAGAAAPELQFALPPELPGGFRLESAYTLDFGGLKGIAGRYRRGSEPLFIFFHPPVSGTRLGVHRESQCHVAGRGGQRVEVGPWRLVHFTDPTTCHCLLSRVTDPAELNAIFAAVAPGFTPTSQP